MLRSFLFCFVFAIFSSLVACNCATGLNEDDAGVDAGDSVDCRRGQLACTIDGEPQCVAYDPASLCETWERCVPGSTTCDASGTPICTCEVAEALGGGTQVAFADSTQLANGALIIAGWNAGLAPHAYKDLNVGWWNPAAEHDVCAAGAVEWEIVRGVPDGGTPIADPDGYRGGVGETGPSVGRYASIITLPDENGDPSNDVLVSYESVTDEGAFVELAHGRFIGADDDGGEVSIAFEWTFHAVEAPAGAIAIAATALTLTESGVPAVSYTVHHAPRPDDADDPRTQPTYEIKLARANLATPAAAEDWQVFTIAGPEDAGCTSHSQCSGDMVCMRGGFFGVCVNEADLSECAHAGGATCDPGAGPPLASPAQSCVNKAEFSDILPANNYLGDSSYNKAAFVDAVCPETDTGTGHCCMDPMRLADYIPVNGLYASLHAISGDRLALISYGRRTGTLDAHVINADGTSQRSRLAGGGSAGDMGPGASAVVDPGNANLLHVAYVDALKSELRYLRATVAGNNVTASALSLIDNGHPSPDLDGREVAGFIGDDSDITIADTEDGLVLRVVYSDTSNHQTVLAQRPLSAGANIPFTHTVLADHLKEGQAGRIGDGNFPTIVNNNDVANPGSGLITSTYRMTATGRAKSDTCVLPYGMTVVDDGDDDDDNDGG